MRARLFDTPRPVRGPRSKCRDLVPRQPDACMYCGGDVRYETIGQLALFRHGGYGATVSRVFALCSVHTCRGVRLVQTIEIRPERRAA